MSEQTSAKTETPVPEKTQTSVERAAGPMPWERLAFATESARDRGDGTLTNRVPDTDARLERLRLVIRGQDRQLAELRRLLEPLLRHQHGPTGALVVPLTFGAGHPTDTAEPDPAKAWL